MTTIPEIDPQIRSEESSTASLPVEIEKMTPAVEQKSNPWVPICALVGFIMIAAGAYTQYQSVLNKTARVRAYIELKVSADGDVAAPKAKVYQNDEYVGMTDSSGEWRRFDKLDPGTMLNFKVTKRINGKIRESSKNFAVPFVDSIRLATTEFKAKVDLTSETASPKPLPVAQEGATQFSRPIAAENSQPTNSAKTIEPSQAANTKNIAETREDSNELASSANTPETDDPKNEASTVQKDLAVVSYESGNESQWSKKDSQQAKWLEADIAKILLKRMDSLDGVAVVLAHLGTGAGKGLMQITIKSKGMESRKFLRNYGATATIAADRVMAVTQWSLKNKRYSNPSKVFTRHRAKLLGAQNDAVVFVGGFEAKALGAGTFEYWGKPRARSNFTALINGVVVARHKVRNRGVGSPNMVPMGVSEIAQNQ